MRKYIFSTILISIFSISSILFAQDLHPVSSASSVAFQIKNLGIRTTGYFKEIEGTIKFNPNNLSNAIFNISIPATSIDTDNNMRDGHLQKEEYFGVSKYPTIKFLSTKVSQTRPGQYLLEGKLTIKDVTKTITFPFTATSQDGGYLLKGELPLNRRDYHVGGRSFTLSDDLTVMLTVMAK